MTGHADTADHGVADAAVRTRLARQRTALSLLLSGALLARLSVERLGLAALPGALVAVLLAGWVTLRSREVRHERRDGLAGALLALAVVVLAASELGGLLS